MDSIINLFHTVSVSPWRDKYIDCFLYGCAEHQAFISNSTAGLHQVVADINSKLNVGSSRYEGLLILKTFLDQCPDEVFVSNAFSWASQAWNALDGISEESNQFKNVTDLSFEVLRHLIELSGQFPNVTKQILPMISKLLRKLTGNESKDLISDTKIGCTMLRCLQSCMKYYTAQCVSYKGAIDKLLLGLLSSKDGAVVHEASNCFLLLSLLHGGGGTKGSQIIGGGNSNCTMAWNQTVSKLVATMHWTLNKLYETAPKYKKSMVKNEKFDFPCEVTENPVLILQNHYIRYVNLAQFLCCMLTDPLPAAKSIPLQEVMSVLCQALSVTCNNLKDKVSSESLALSVCIPHIHVATLSVLSALMACARLSLLPYGSLITKLLMQSLKWTGDVNDWPSGVRKPYNSLRTSAYSCLSLWLQISSSASCAEVVADELIGMALLDIVPSREKLTLVSAESSKKHHGKRHKRRKLEVADCLIDNGSAPTSGFRCAIGNGSANYDTCCAALDVLTYLLYSVGPFLKPNQHKVIQEKVVPILVDIQRSSNNILNHKDMSGRCQSTNMILPYQSNAECRLYLYKLLLALVMEPHSHKMPPPLGIAAKLFETGSNDPNIEVSSFCFTSVRTVERLLHPCASTLNFPVVLSELAGDKQSTYLSSVINRVRLRESFVHERNAVEENIIAKLTPPVEKQNGPLNEYLAPSDYEPQQSENGSPSPSSIAEPENGERSARTSSNEVVLVHRIESSRGNLSIQGTKLANIPVTTIQSIGIQVSDETMEDDAEYSLSSSCSSQTGKVLVLKLPLEKTASAESRKDFAQQWESGKNCKEVEHEEVEYEEVDLEEEHHDHSEGIVDLHKSGTQVPKGLESDSNNCDDVVLVEQESTDGVSIGKDMENHVCKNGETHFSKLHVGPSRMLSTENHIEVVDIDDHQADRISPATKETKVVELDVDHLSESEEMISCFVDVASDSE